MTNKNNLENLNKEVLFNIFNRKVEALFKNIDISGKRLKDEDFKTYKKRRSLLNKILRHKLKDEKGNPVNTRLYPYIQSFKGGYRNVVSGISEHDVITMFKEIKVKTLI